MALETLSLKAKGLSRYSDPYSSRPQGSLNEASNIVIDQENLFTPRRGFEKLGNENSSQLVGKAKNILPFRDELICYAPGSTNKTLNLLNKSTGAFTELSGFSSTSDYIKYAESNGNLYFTGDTGVYKLETPSSTVIEAGIPEALGGYGAANANLGWLGDNQTVAYKLVWGTRDENDNLVLGPPSARIWVSKGAGGAKDVDLVFYVPAEIDTRFFFQLYRTTQVPTGTDPGAEFFLVQEGNYVSGSTISITDSTPEDLLTQGLYTNATREGAEAANYQPPKCSDITTFNNHMFFSDVSSRHTLNLQLLAVGTTAAQGIRIDDTVTIAGQTYTGKAAESVANKQFIISNVPDPVVDIRITAESLVKCINGNAANTTVYAYYDSDENDLPGLIRIETRDFGGAGFTAVATTNKDPFFPSLKTSQSSKSESLPNALYWSKMNEPEAVPLANMVLVGSKAKPIKRILALRESLFIFKEDGIFRLTGTSSSNFSVDAFDSSFKVLAPNTLCVLSNQIYGLFDQGICQISESGVVIISIDLEGDIRGYVGSHYNTLKSLSFAFGYETDRKYILWLPSGPLDTFPTLAYVYNTVTNTWTTWDRDAWAGVVDPATDRIFMQMADLSYNLLSKERKDSKFTDFADEQLPITANSVTGTVIVVSSLTGLEVGDMYVESSSKFSKILSIDPATTSITVKDDLEWATGAVEVRKTYTATIEWNPIHLNTPGHMKQWFEVLTMATKDFDSATLRIKTEGDGGYAPISLTGSSFSDWGLFPWGEVPWGGVADVLFAHRTYVPRTKQRASTIHLKLEIPCVYTDWAITGMEVTYRDAGSRLLRR